MAFTWDKCLSFRPDAPLCLQRPSRFLKNTLASSIFDPVVRASTVPELCVGSWCPRTGHSEKLDSVYASKGDMAQMNELRSDVRSQKKSNRAHTKKSEAAEFTDVGDKDKKNYDIS